MIKMISLIRYERWKQRKLKDPDLINEINQISDNSTAINQRFGSELDFGTGGARGYMGAGTNRINIYTIGKITQGYANYLNRHHTYPCVIAVAYDSRIKSDIFAKSVCEIFAANGITSYIFNELVPTPLLSFAVRDLQCLGGVVITASHNPSDYNGYKIYNSTGGQITSQTAGEISREMADVDVFDDVISMEFEQGLKNNLIKYIDESLIFRYLEAVSKNTFYPSDTEKNISVVYSPLNGTGLKPVTLCMRQNGYNNLKIVEEQKEPNGRFPTCPKPNPELPEAMELSIKYAKEQKADVVLVTDPDADRVGAAILHQGDYYLLSGNETGILLLNYICERKAERGLLPSNAVVIKSIVTTDMLKLIAQDYQINVKEVLTGFKYIGELVTELERQGMDESFILGVEESCGYLIGSYIRDKDGIEASLIIAELVYHYKKSQQSLLDVLNKLYEKYGYWHNAQKTIDFNDVAFEKSSRIMDWFRSKSIKKLGSFHIRSFYDFRSSTALDINTGISQDIELPKSNVIKYILEDNTTVTIRPSGTEAKLKIYLSIFSKDGQNALTLENVIISELYQLINTVLPNI